MSKAASRILSEAPQDEALQTRTEENCHGNLPLASNPADGSPLGRGLGLGGNLPRPGGRLSLCPALTNLGLVGDSPGQLHGHGRSGRGTDPGTGRADPPGRDPRGPETPGTRSRNPTEDPPSLRP